jgi:hypothetical protein
VKRFLVIAAMLLCAHAAQAAEFSFVQYEAVLKAHVRPDARFGNLTSSAVDYAALAKDAADPGSPYSLLLKQLAAFDPADLETREEKTAFWINVYNIAAIKTIVDYYPVDTIRSAKINSLGLPWGRAAITVGGEGYSLERIELAMLLNAFRELNIYFCLCNTSIASPALRIKPYQAASLSQEIVSQAQAFLADPKKGMHIDKACHKVVLSQMFKSNISRYVSLAGSAEKVIAPFLPAADGDFLNEGTYTVAYFDYDWNVNDAAKAVIPETAEKKEQSK